MRLYLEKRVVTGLIIALVIMVLLAVLTILNNRRFNAAAAIVTHTHEVLYRSEELLSSIMDLETGQRGYTITGDTVFLAPYTAALPRIDKNFNELQALTADNPLQQKRLTILRALIDKKVVFTNDMVNLTRQHSDLVEKRTSSFEGKNIMDKIRKIVAEFKGHEKSLLAIRVSKSNLRILWMNATLVGLFLITLFVLGFVLYLINVHLKARMLAEAALRKASNEIQDLYDYAPCGYHSLDHTGTFISINNTLLSWLQYSREEVIDKLSIRDIISPEDTEKFATAFPAFKVDGKLNNMELRFMRKDGTVFPAIINSTAIFDNDGQYLRSRSSVFDNTERKYAEDKLHSINRELEEFTYTISHDLRAPLRSLDGYSRILSEEHANELNPEGHRILAIIMKNARFMGQLIDDLLEFSRLGKLEMQKKHILMGDFIEEIVNKLANPEREKGKKIEVTNFSEDPALVDVRMIRQVWLNLIANALKYSSKKEVSSLEIGSYSSPAENTFYVKDNGVGFDMQYQSKLFGVFQRLHKSQDFEGTGVGLAITKRIIDRHGGRVWAESTLGQGATFYFSIPNNEINA